MVTQRDRCVKTGEIVEKIKAFKKKIEKKFYVDRIVIFGSAAKG